MGAKGYSAKDKKLKTSTLTSSDQTLQTKASMINKYKNKNHEGQL
jgi:hypothetical protein